MREGTDTFLGIVKLILSFALLAAVLNMLISGLKGITLHDDIDLPPPTYTVQCFQNGHVVLTEHITGKLDTAWFKNEFTVTTEKGAVSVFNGESCVVKNTDEKTN